MESFATTNQVELN